VKDIQKWIGEHNGDVLTLDGHDNAILGLSCVRGHNPIVIYDPKIIVANLVAQGMTEDEAEEFYYFNIECLYVGLGTPAMLIRVPDEEELDGTDLEEDES
jgi:hypothetical protein